MANQENSRYPTQPGFVQNAESSENFLDSQWSINTPYLQPLSYSAYPRQEGFMPHSQRPEYPDKSQQADYPVYMQDQEYHDRNQQSEYSACNQQQRYPDSPQPPSYSQQPVNPAYTQSYLQSGDPQPFGDHQVPGVAQAPVVMIPAYQVHPHYLENRSKFFGVIVLSAVAIPFGLLFGIAAFALALVGKSAASRGEVSTAKSLLRGSFALSVIGIVLGPIALLVYFIVPRTYNSNYYYYHNY